MGCKALRLAPIGQKPDGVDPPRPAFQIQIRGHQLKPHVSSERYKQGVVNRDVGSLCHAHSRSHQFGRARDNPNTKLRQRSHGTPNGGLVGSRELVTKSVGHLEERQVRHRDPDTAVDVGLAQRDGERAIGLGNESLDEHGRIYDDHRVSLHFRMSAVLSSPGGNLDAFARTSSWNRAASSTCS